VVFEAHANYQRLVDAAAQGHAAGRAARDLASADIELARLYSYAFRTQTIGAFHGTRQALEDRPSVGGQAHIHRQRAVELLEDLGNLAMEEVPDDFRALLSTFYRYDLGARRVCDALKQECNAGGDGEVGVIADRFAALIQTVTCCNGIYLTQDLSAPQQACYVVPNLGITIVPLVYGDHHSWNLAEMGDGPCDVPRHMHDEGVEIHLGYSPMHGYLVLDDNCADVSEGYALPIPPRRPHGYINGGEMQHHVPFIFGSLRFSGWGVFFDVEAKPCVLGDLTEVNRQGPKMNQATFLERDIDEAAALSSSRRWPILPASATFAPNVGGIELSVARATTSGLHYPLDGFRILSVVRGNGKVRIGKVEQFVGPHDHCGVPAGMECSMVQHGPVPLVVLDTVIYDDPAKVSAQRRGARVM
jgi:mannose-6-phosphate isomerase-like protein (cupin superfamily)